MIAESFTLVLQKVAIEFPESSSWHEIAKYVDDLDGPFLEGRQGSLSHSDDAILRVYQVMTDTYPVQTSVHRIGAVK